MTLPEVTFYDYDPYKGKMASYKVIDDYESLIWHEKFIEAGDFELYLVATPNILLEIIPLTFVGIPDSDTFMMIEKIELKQEAGEADHIIISGRDWRCLFETRVFWKSFLGTSSKKIYNILKSILSNEQSGETALFQIYKWNEQSQRYFIESNFVTDSIDDTISDIYLEDDESAEYIGRDLEGTNLYSEIIKICTRFGIGWKMYESIDGKIHANFHKGIDRSTDQSNVVPVIFSKKFENLLSFKHISDYTNYKNDGYVDILLSSYKYLTNIPIYNTYHGLTRRELYTVFDMTQMSIFPTYELGTTYGRLVLAYNYCQEEKTECEIEPNDTNFIFKKHYNIGDIVEVESEFGIIKKLTCSGSIISYDTNGFTIIPEFEEY